MRPGPASRFQSELERLERTQAEEALPHLELLWHYDCVVSPRSPSPKAASSLGSPRSPLLASGLLSSSSSSASSESSPLSPRSPVAVSDDGSLCGISVETGVRTLAASESSPLALDRVSPSLLSANDTSAARHQHLRGSLQHVFTVFDEDGDGHVSISELCSIFTKLRIPKSQESMEFLLASSPRCLINGRINQEEFLLLYESVCASVEELEGDMASSLGDMEETDGDEDLGAAFHVFDLDGNGYISAEDLQSVLCALGFMQAKNLEACMDMIARVDENGDGQVDFSEFKKLMGAVTTPSLIRSC